MRVARHLSWMVATGVVTTSCAGFPDKAPQTLVVLDNDYASSTQPQAVLYQAYWLNVAFQTPVPPGSSSTPQAGTPASANTAYALVAPGWDPDGGSPPTSFVVLRSKVGYGVDLGDTLHIAVSSDTFDGDCAAGDPLDQAEADFLTQVVFSSAFAGLTYDAPTCTTTSMGDSSAP